MNEIDYLKLTNDDGTSRVIGIIGLTNKYNTNIENILMEMFPDHDGYYEFVDRYDYLSDIIIVDDFDQDQFLEES